MRLRTMMVVCLLVIAGCGGGGGGSSTPPQPPPAAPAPPPVIGAAGGTIVGTTGATVIVPAGALSEATTIRIAMDSTGAPPIPQSLTSAGNVYAITPHGATFNQPVEVRIPAPAVALLPTQQLKLAKTLPNGEWLVIEDSELSDGLLTAKVQEFSFFMAIVVTYPLPILQFEPLTLDTTLTCGDQDCLDALGNVDATFTVTTNNGQFPAECTNGSLEIHNGNTTWFGTDGAQLIPRSGGSKHVVVIPNLYFGHWFKVIRRCAEANYSYSNSTTWQKQITWTDSAAFPYLRIVRSPAQLDVVEGLPANLDVILSGGATPNQSAGPRAPTVLDRAVIDWQRSDDSGASWRTIATSFQSDADPLPFPGIPWRYWASRHGFIAASTDQGALMRVHACYTPPAPTAAQPCVTSTATRINVLQQSASPVIVTQPRSVLVRTIETASFSVSATGLPAPTLQWQTRPGNSTGAWSNVVVGLGFTAQSYTTQPLMLDNNGTQYRVVATNSLGSAASAPVTVSVSDSTIAPSITTQPANLSVVSGGDAIFAIDAYGTEALSYQWRFNGADIAGANSPILRLGGVTGANAGSYSVSVGNSAGDADSNNATLIVTNGTATVVAPGIVTQPTNITVNVGSAAAFAVGVSGTGPFTFQWRRNGSNIQGATTAAITVPSVALPNAGAYSVVINNAAGSVTSADAVLDVNASSAPQAPSITTQPAALILPIGGSGIMAVGATGSGPLSYQWYHDGVAIPAATQPVLAFTQIASGAAGNYTVTVTNSVSSSTSQAATLLLLGVPSITQHPVDTTVLQSATATFSVQASGPDLHYQWSRNGNPLSGATSATYATPTMVADSGAVYRVAVYNGAGLVTSQAAVLTVLAVTAPSVSIQPVNRSVLPGETAALCAAFGGTGPFTLVMQRFGGINWDFALDNIVFPDNGEYCLATPVLQAGDNGVQFRFVATNAAGSIATSGATITVSSPAVITATTLVSRAIDGGPSNNISDHPSTSADGRYVAFLSVGDNLVAGASTSGNAYVRDLVAGTTRLVNYNLAGNVSSQGVFEVKLSSNGRYAIFTSRAGDLVAGDTNNGLDVFRRDLVNGTTQRLSLLPNGTELPFGIGGNGEYQLGISADGAVVTFRCSYAIDDTGTDNDIYFLFYRNVQTGLTRKVAGISTADVAYSALSDDGQSIAYAYGTPPPASQVIEVYDINSNSNGSVLAFDQSTSQVGLLREGMSISSNGRYVAFSIAAPGVFGTAESQVLVADRNLPGQFVNASAISGVVGNGRSAWPEISGDGRYVLFSTYAPSLTGNVANSSTPYLVVRDVVGGNIVVASRRANGTALATGPSPNMGHALSEDGSVLAFVADHADATGVPAGTQVFASPRPQ